MKNCIIYLNNCSNDKKHTSLIKTWQRSWVITGPSLDDDDDEEEEDEVEEDDGEELMIEGYLNFQKK